MLNLSRRLLLYRVLTINGFESAKLFQDTKDINCFQKIFSIRIMKNTKMAMLVSNM